MVLISKKNLKMKAHAEMKFLSLSLAFEIYHEHYNEAIYWYV